MTAKIDTTVQAAAPVVLPISTLPAAPMEKAGGLGARPGLPGGAPIDPAAHRRAREERVARWKTITETGGIDAWVTAQLAAKGLAEGGDPGKMSDRERAQYKERKKAEAKERRALRRLAWEAYLETHVSHLGSGVHWEDGAEVDKLDPPNREERARSIGLPGLTGADDLAGALELPVAKLRWLAYHRDVDTGSHYRRWQIPKRDGSARTIAAPKRDLKRV